MLDTRHGALDVRAGPDRAEVLVVDDDHDTLDSIAEVLDTAGFRVTATSSGQAALTRLARGYHPAAMLVDLRMPEMTGPEFLRACRADPALAGIPAILTSCGFRSDFGVADTGWFLQKPFGVEDLIDMIGEVLQSSPPPS